MVLHFPASRFVREDRADPRDQPQGAPRVPIASGQPARPGRVPAAGAARPSSYELYLAARRVRAQAIGDALNDAFAAGLRHFRRRLRGQPGNADD